MEKSRSRIFSLLGTAAISIGGYYLYQALGGRKTMRAGRKQLMRLMRREIVLPRERFPFLYYGRPESPPIHFKLLGRRSVAWRPLIHL